MIDLYTWTTPNGRKVSIMLEELGVEYAAHAIDIGKDAQFAADFLAISPNNKIPAIVDRDNGQSVFESGAILIYLAEKYGRFLGDGAARTATLEWLMWQMGGFGPMLGQSHHFLQFNPGQAPYAEERFANEAKRLYGVLNTRLHGRDFIVDTLSIADFAIWPWASRFEWQRIDLNQFPNVKKWYLRCAEREAFQKGHHCPKNTGDIPMP
jgi:GST-like protein